MQTTTHTPSMPASAPVFFSGLYGETIKLLLDAQHYFTARGRTDQAMATPVERVVYSSEMSRITLRLSAVMAWLMARRAEHAGEISHEDAVTRFRLEFQDICLKDLPEMHHVLPSTMCDLLARSLQLYRRAARLDEMVGSAHIIH